MIINLKLDYNPETETIKVKSCAVEHETAPESKKIIESNEPQVLLDSNKYSFNAAAIELMSLQPNIRVDIKYQMIDGVEYPVIGTEEAFGTGGGNKLTKSMTVSYRGKAAERLARFGETFTLTPLKGNNGLFVLVGDKNDQGAPDGIEIKEDMTNNDDITDMDNDPLDFDVTEFESMEDGTLIDEESLKFE